MARMPKTLKEAIKELEQLHEEMLPRNIKSRIELIIKAIQEKNPSLGIDYALQELEEISEDANIDSIARSRILKITSLLEKSR